MQCVDYCIIGYVKGEVMFVVLFSIKGCYVVYFQVGGMYLVGVDLCIDICVVVCYEGGEFFKYLKVLFLLVQFVVVVWNMQYLFMNVD